MSEVLFEEEYKKLNKAQKEAVDSIDGPVMVVAGPGTGKTQILALRIGNILKKTDVGADSILCLTFTNSAVSAMRDRLYKYIGNTASKVQVRTFHKFSAEIIEEFYEIVGFETLPRILEEAEGVSICDQILRENEWQHIRPKNDIGRYFKELKSLISLLKRERLTPEKFLEEIKNEISEIEKNPENISTRGESKGRIKKEFTSKIESLERTKETVLFYELYEKKKKEENLLDYDDSIKYALEIIEQSEEARASICEKYLYVLVDEHQDSSGVQNDLLKAIWQKEEKPNIFAVGDDRQLIYAFGGAKISHFEEFKTMFGKTKIIFLTDNYRSTENILKTADSLLSSSFSEQKLLAVLKDNHNLKLVEADYPRDEILACGLEIKEKLKDNKININNCAILVPKNRQVVSAMRILKDLGLKVASMQSLSLFETNEFETILRILKICVNSYDAVSLSESILDPVAQIPVLSAHQYLYRKRGKDISLEEILSEQNNLFNEYKEIRDWIEKLKNIVSVSAILDIYSLIQTIGDEVLIKTAKEHNELVHRIEIIRSMLHLALSFSEKNNKSINSITDYIYFIERLREYGEEIPLASFQSEEGVKVMTLHASKGLEFDFVWIAHMNENELMKGKRRNFKLPESIASKVEEKDELAAKRELYVAITRAKRFCNISHSRFSYGSQNLELAKIISELLISVPDIFEKSSFQETEAKIFAQNPRIYITSNQEGSASSDVSEKLTKLVAKEYIDVNVSVSMLNNFFECPNKWYFRNLLKLPEVKSESLEFGNKVHTALDKILKLDKIPTEKEIEKITESNKEVFKIIDNWVKNTLPKISKIRENEKSISVHYKDFSHLNIYGKLDLIENIGDNLLRVVDFKTGNPRKKSEIEKINEEGRMSDYMRQLAMYSFLLEESRKGKVRVEESRLEFLEAKSEKESFYTTFIGEENIKLLIKDIKDYDELVKTGKWITRECHFHSYGRQNTECEYCKMAEIYK